LVSGLLGKMLGVDQIYGAARSVGSWVGRKVQNYMGSVSLKKEDLDHGNARWEKTFFVLSRVDEVYKEINSMNNNSFSENSLSDSNDNTKNGHNGQQENSVQRNHLDGQMFYELGLAFGRR